MKICERLLQLCARTDHFNLGFKWQPNIEQSFNHQMFKLQVKFWAKRRTVTTKFLD